jgi:hypothetical protein
VQGHQRVFDQMERASSRDATWESEQVLYHPGLVLLEDKQFQEGRTVMSLSK